MKFRIAGSIFASGAALSLLLSGAYGRNHGSLEEHKHVRGGDKSAKVRALTPNRHLDATKVEGGKFADQPRIQRRLEKIRRKRQLAGTFKRGVQALGGGADENPTIDLAECSSNVLNDDQASRREGGHWTAQLPPRQWVGLRRRVCLPSLDRFYQGRLLCPLEDDEDESIIHPPGGY